MDNTFTLAGKTKVVPPSAVSSGRYSFLSLSEAEPNLGIPDGTGVFFLTGDITGYRGWAQNLPDINLDFVDSIEIRTNWLSAVSANIDELYVKSLTALSATINFLDLYRSTGFLVNGTIDVEENINVGQDVNVGGDVAVFGNANILNNVNIGQNVLIGDSLSVVNNITANDVLFDILEANHIKAKTKSFLVNHPTKKDKKLHYGSLESPYHGIRLTGKGEVKNGAGIVELPEYIRDFVLEEDVNIQITNYKHAKILYVDTIDISGNKFTVKLDGFFNKFSDYQFFWSFTAIRKDVEKLLVEE